MASGRVHSTVSILASGAILATIPVAGPLVVPLAAGCFSGIFVSPDLDSNGETNQHHQVRRFLGVAGDGFSLLWYLLWRPYALHFRHRSRDSHLPVWSTLIRVLYLFLVTGFGGLGLIPGLLWYAWQHGLWDWYSWAGLWLYGLVISDFLHFLFDVIKFRQGRIAVAQLGD